MGGQNILGFIFFYIQNGKSTVNGYRHAEHKMEICHPDLHSREIQFHLIESVTGQQVDKG